MFKTNTRALFLILLLAALLVACDGQPLVMVTLAPTAESVPDVAQPVVEPTPTIAVTNPAPAPEAEVTAPSETEQNAAEATGTEVAFAAVVATSPETPEVIPPPLYTYEIVNTYPHDVEAFTQGLVYLDDGLYEGTGQWGASTLREVALESGAVLRSHALESQYFGEGITVLNDRVYQLTWQEQTGFVYNRRTFEPVQTFNYSHEGWGITHDGSRLIVSDGTSTLYFWDPQTLQEVGRVTVRDHEGPLNRLNELEYINGEVWANVWLTDLIARISPETGEVLGYIDLTGLLDTRNLQEPVDVLNGIAYDAENDRIFVTGKLWPTLFEVRIIPAP